MKPRACAYCGKPLAPPPVRRLTKAFCSREHLEKYRARRAFWRGLDDMGNVGGPGC